MAVPTKDLLEFLTEAELKHYHADFVTKLKVNTVPQLKYVVDEDLQGLGMSKPEIRRLRQFFKKEHPKGALVMIKKILAKGPADVVSQSTVSISPPILEKPVGPSRHVISEDSVSLHKIIGTGEFGYVQQGVWTKDNGEQMQVAVKCLPKDVMKSQTTEFLEEATIMHSICHPHIVQLFGVILGSDSFMLVTEYAPMKSLLECLKDQALKPAFTIRHLCDLSGQLAEGMTYLEKNRLIHRDLAARNVLVFAEDKVKISDFGLSRALGVGSDYYQSQLNTGLKLPIAWCAPECINFLKFTSASDVWSFGVLLWEVFSYGEQPWLGLTGLEIMQAIDAPNHQRLPQSARCPEEWYSLMNECWGHEPSERPKFSEICSNIQQMKPPQVIMMRDTPVEDTAGEEYLKYRTKNVVTVLSKMPSDPPRSGMWKGILELTGEVGHFDPTHSSPYFEVVPPNQLLRKIKLNRAESARLSIRNAYKTTPNLISKPQNDLRHLGHVGYDGVCFGDVSFIGNNYDKLPNKSSTTRRSEDDLRSSRSSLPVNGSKLGGGSKFTGFSASSSTLTDTPVLSEDDELAGFELPGISDENDAGSSLMEEVLKVLSAATSEDDNEMRGLLAGFESLGLSVDPNVAGKGEPRRQTTDARAIHGKRPVARPADLPPEVSPLARPQSSFSTSSSTTSIKTSPAIYNNVVPISNGTTAGLKKPSQPPPSVSTFRDARIPPVIPSKPVVVEDKIGHNGDKVDEGDDDDEEEDDDDIEEEEEEDGSLFESSSYSSSKEVSDRYNGMDEDKKSKSSSLKEHSPLHGALQSREAVSSNSSKSESLKRFSQDASKQSPTTSSNSRISISSPKPLETSNIAIARLTSRKSVEYLDEAEGRASTSVTTPAAVVTHSSKLNPTLTSAGNRTAVNQKLRIPIIPGRQAPIATTEDDDAAAVDTNPLRRLRQSAGSTGPRPMMTFRPIVPGGVASADQSARNLNINASFFDKLKEQQRQQ